MGFRISVLVVLAGIIWAAGSVSYPVGSGCIECHAPHNEIYGPCIDCHRGNPRTHRLRIAHYRLIGRTYAYFNFPQSPVVESGRMLIEKMACRRCHRTGGSGNQLAADLDRIPSTFQPQDLATAIKEPAFFMPNFYFTETQIGELVNAVLAGAGTEPDVVDIPIVIHFASKSENRSILFNKNCGTCHRVLNKQFGGLGLGNIGPNLSGLLTSFYPQNYKGETAWNPEGLKRWLENPRDIRVNALMPPVKLSTTEFANILTLFHADFSI